MGSLSSRALLLAFPLLVLVASLSDVAADLAEGSSRAHLIRELLLMLSALGVCVWLVVVAGRNRQQVEALRAELDNIRQLPSPESRQLANARRELAIAINEQFAAWQLTPSEKEIGQFLLKGFSLKEIAQLRGTAEKTIRHQASSLYQKAGVTGRHTFAAWFLEDLL